MPSGFSPNVVMPGFGQVKTDRGPILENVDPRPAESMHWLGQCRKHNARTGKPARRPQVHGFGATVHVLCDVFGHRAELRVAIELSFGVRSGSAQSLLVLPRIIPRQSRRRKHEACEGAPKKREPCMRSCDIRIRHPPKPHEMHRDRVWRWMCPMLRATCAQ